MLKGICDYCGNVGFIHTCVLCGAKVCKEHYNPERRLCSKCEDKAGSLKPGLTQGKLKKPELVERDFEETER